MRKWQGLQCHYPADVTQALANTIFGRIRYIFFSCPEARRDCFERLSTVLLVFNMYGVSAIPSFLPLSLGDNFSFIRHDQFSGGRGLGIKVRVLTYIADGSVI